MGLPWIGAHFRLDRVGGAFSVVVNLGGAMASLYGLGYGQHESGQRAAVLPAFLAGMNLVVLADDAFTFLLTWEFMSLTSWALVMAHHRQSDNAKAGYIYLLMASLGTLSLLLALGLLAGPAGDYGFDAIRKHAPRPAGPPPFCCWPWSEPDPRRGSCRCTFGCHSPTRPRPVTCRR